MTTQTHDYRIVLVGRQRIFLESLAAAIGESAQLSVVDTCQNLETVHQKMDEREPHLVVFDAQSGGNELDSIARFVGDHPGVPVVVLGSSVGAPSRTDFLEEGALGFVSKDSSIEHLTTAIGHALGDERFCSPSMAKELFDGLRELSDKKRRIDVVEGCNLTHRELEILGLVAAGLRNREIAEELSLSPHTVKNHVHRILEKLQVRHRSAAVAEAFRRNWISQDGSRLAS